MNASPASIIFQFARAVVREAINFKTWVVLLFAVVSLAVLAVGMVYPKTFTSSTTIHADRQNIIKPLLAGQAQTTNVSDHVRFVREVVVSPRLLKELVLDLELLEDPDNERAIEALSRSIGSSLSVKSLGPYFIKIEYSGEDPAQVYNIVSKITDMFIKDSSETKRKESREAFLFIDKQAKSYKAQLVDAEEKLKQFNANNFDGTEDAAKARIGRIRDEIETIKLDIEETQTRIVSLEKELKNESQVVENRYRADEFRLRLADAQSRLDTLLLTYTEDYPDVVALKQQIEDLKQTIRNSESPVRGTATSDVSANPLYEELRSRVSTQKVELNTKKRRLARTELKLEEEYKRLERIAAQQAELAELTRDYSVTKSIYEDMLSRKEKARLSMTLDVEGQGVTYRIQEPAAFPLSPKGMKFLHFFLAGPILGALVPLGLLIVYVQLDPRIRFKESLEAITDVPVLGVVPHMTSPLSKRVMKSDVILLGTFLIIILCLYVAIAFAHRAGMI